MLEWRVASRLTIVGTPIGNLEDLTLRAKRVLSEADVIFCEDTRETAKLLARYGVRKPTSSLHKFSVARKLGAVIARLEAGEKVCYVTDSGMPGIADPGCDVARRLLDAGYGVEVVPGVSALTTAVTFCPFVESGFVFAGFLPRKPSEMKKRLGACLDTGLPVVFFESPARIGALIANLAAVLPSKRRAMLARELTKKFEEVTIFPLGEPPNPLPERGEMVLIVEGGEPSGAAKGRSADEAAAFLDGLGLSARDTASVLAYFLGAGKSEMKRKVYK